MWRVFALGAAGAGAIALQLALAALGIAQIYLGWLGLDYLVDWWAPWVGLALALLAGFMLPFTIGTYFGATEVLGWPWWAGVLIALPGLIFMVPALIAILAEKLTR